jgi:hypothetical protein
MSSWSESAWCQSALVLCQLQLGSIREFLFFTSLVVIFSRHRFLNSDRRFSYAF